MAYYKWKPNKAALEKWLVETEDFKNEIKKIEAEFKTGIIVNKKANSVYFTNKNGENFRISTHHSELAEMVGSDGINGSGFELPKNNWVTNSKKNILKLTRKALEN